MGKMIVLLLAVLLAGCSTDGGGLYGGNEGGGGGGKPTEGLPTGAAKVMLLEVDGSLVDIRVVLGGDLSPWSQVGLCYLTGDAAAGMPTTSTQVSSLQRIVAGQSAYDFTLAVGKPEQWLAVRCYLRSQDYRVAYGDCIRFVTTQGNGLAKAGKPTVTMTDGGTVVIASTLTAQPTGLKSRGFCILGATDRPSATSPRIAAQQGQGLAFSMAVDTLRRGIAYGIWGYVDDAGGLRFGDSVRFRIPAPELMPRVGTLGEAEVWYAQVTARGTLEEGYGGKPLSWGIEWCRTPDFGQGMWRSTTGKMAADGTFEAWCTVAEPGTLYYRAFAETVYGRAYGEARSVVVPPFAQYRPLVTTEDRPALTASSATVAGSVTNPGPKILERGFWYGTSSNPEVSDSKQEVMGTTGRMTGLLSGLKSQTYYYRAYARNAAGIGYGQNRSFSIRVNDFQVVFRDLKVKIPDDRTVTFSVTIWDRKGQSIKEQGFCWTNTTYAEPTIGDDKAKYPYSTGYSYSLDVRMYEFRRGETYYARAYAITEDGTVWYSDRLDKVKFTIPE